MTAYKEKQALLKEHQEEVVTEEQQLDSFLARLKEDDFAFGDSFWIGNVEFEVINKKGLAMNEDDSEQPFVITKEGERELTWAEDFLLASYNLPLTWGLSWLVDNYTKIHSLLMTNNEENLASELTNLCKEIIAGLGGKENTDFN